MILIITGLSVGLGVARRRVKSVLPEKQLLVFLSGRYKPLVRPRASSAPTEVRRASRTPETVEVIARDSTRIPTIKIVGVLRDHLGNPVSNQELEVIINNKLYTRVKTGSSGEYTIYYSPDGPGLYDVEIRLHGRTVLKKRVKVGVRS